MRRSLILLLVATLCLTGCWDRQEVNDLAIVDLVAIDKAPQGLRLTVSVVVPSKAAMATGDGGGDGGGSKTAGPAALYSAEGETIMDASVKLQKRLSRRLFWGHTRTLIIGEAFARSGVRPAFDFWSRHREPRLRMQVAVTPGLAEAFIKARPRTERLLSEQVREAINMRLQANVTIGEFLGWLRSEIQQPFAPRLTLVTQREGSDVLITGTAIFQDDKMVGWLDDAQTRGMLWLRDEVQQAVVTVPISSGGKVSMRLIHSSSKIRPALVGGELRMRAHFEIDSDIYESTAQIDLSDPEVVLLLEEYLRRDVMERAQAALRALQQTYGVDALGFGAQVHRLMPRLWEGGLKQRWPTVFRDLPVEISVSAYLRRTGEHGPPLGATQRQVQSQTQELLKSKE